ncbi:hypothetical protein PM116P4_00038 [Parabacteroides phage PM116P4]|nr:hypothetical protein PM116P4_00038 [Parabacteroides phage PM116P4]WAX17531.1 hypothetical protein PM116P5_00015 [Parabacteroides phage PM116P5]
MNSEDIRSYNVGASDYSKHDIQPWDIWEEYDLNPWDADIVKRVLRNKSTDSRIMDYEKIIHICEKRIDMLKKLEQRKPVDTSLGYAAERYHQTSDSPAGLYDFKKIQKAIIAGYMCTLVGWTEDNKNFIFKIDWTNRGGIDGESYESLILKYDPVIPLSFQQLEAMRKARYFVVDYKRAKELIYEQ